MTSKHVFGWELDLILYYSKTWIIPLKKCLDDGTNLSLHFKYKTTVSKVLKALSTKKRILRLVVVFQLVVSPHIGSLKS